MGVALGMGDPERPDDLWKEERHPPRAVCVAGALWMAMGIGAVAEMVQAALDETWRINLLAIGILIGNDIWRGKRWGRQWGRGLALAGFVIASIAVVLLGIGAVWLDFAVAVLWAGGCLWVFRLLDQVEAVGWFKGGAPRSQVWKRWRFAVVAAAVVLGAGQLLFFLDVKRVTDALYVFDVRVEAYDSETGEALSVLGSSKTGPTGGVLSGASRFKSTLGTSGGQRTVRASGADFRPVEFEIHVEGYGSREVVIDSGSGETVRVGMRPKEEGE